MTHPIWLAEFHRRWHAARSRTARASTRPYGLNWNALLDAAGITRAEDIRAAVREAEALEHDGCLKLKRHRYRCELIERITLPLDREGWLHQLFHSEDTATLQTRSLGIIDRQPEHPLLPDEWMTLLATLHGAFRDEATIRPFRWRKPHHLAELLETLFDLTCREWPEGTLVRSASVELGQDSKFLERRQMSINRGLSLMFGRPATLADLGIVVSHSMLHFHGPLILHFPDGSMIDYSGRAPHKISLSDLELAIRIETSAQRLLTIENEKTTFRQFASANQDGTTLLVASSFPTQALTSLLGKLPPPFEHHHFGDSDATGFLILLKIREIAPGPVHAYHMRWRGSDPDVPISSRDLAILSKLSGHPLMADCQESINALSFTRCMGRFEQESLGPPTLPGWPFFKSSK